MPHLHLQNVLIRNREFFIWPNLPKIAYLFSVHTVFIKIFVQKISMSHHERGTLGIFCLLREIIEVATSLQEQVESPVLIKFIFDHF